MSIFGNGAPKFVANFGLTDEATVLLDYWVTDKNEMQSKETIIESELTAERVILPRGEYLNFSGTINLFKYGTMPAIRSKFEEIYQYNKTEVVLFAHRDGVAFKDSDGNEVLFFLNITPKYLASTDFRDLLIIEFRSLTAVDFSNSSTIIPTLSEIKILGLK